MPRPFEHWHVLPHGKLSEIDPGTLTVWAAFGCRWEASAADDGRSLARESLRRILVSHGDPIEENPRQTLRRLAESIA